MHPYKWLILFLFFSSRSFAQDHHSDIHSPQKNKGQSLVIFSASQAPGFHLDGKGLVEHRTADGQLLYRAFVLNGKLDAVWTSWYLSGKMLDSGRLDKNLPDGEWKTWYPDGQLATIRHFNANAYRQVSEEIRLAHPKRSFFPLTALSRTNKARALAYLGVSAIYPAAGNHPYRSPEDLVNANASGSHPYQPVFAQGLLDGLYMDFWPGGMVKDSGIYRKGLRTGVWMHRDISGAMETGAYQDGEPHREWKLYSAAGALQELFHYRKGELIWRKSYH